MPLNLSYEDICAKFDRLITNGIITYQPSKPILVTDNRMIVRPHHTNSLTSPLINLQFSFHLVETLKTKPQAEDAPETAKSSLINGVSCQPISFGPGSDIANDHPDMCITTVNRTHYLVMNKFPVFRPMLLLLTVDSYRRQHEPLALDDMEAGWSAICGLKEEHYVFFNCGVLAGSSREHKHLQVVPAPGRHEGYDERFKWFPDDDEQTGPGFVHYLQRFDELPGNRLEGGNQLLEIYLRLLQQTREALDLSADVPCPHNFVLTRRWLVVIPRRAKEFHGITANSAGMMGSVYIWTQEQLDAWKRIGPMNVLRGLGLPKGE
jgi:ATP adenylyltransferase